MRVAHIIFYKIYVLTRRIFYIILYKSRSDLYNNINNINREAVYIIIIYHKYDIINVSFLFIGMIR